MMQIGHFTCLERIITASYDSVDEELEHKSTSSARELNSERRASLTLRQLSPALDKQRVNDTREPNSAEE